MRLKPLDLVALVVSLILLCFVAFIMFKVINTEVSMCKKYFPEEVEECFWTGNYTIRRVYVE